MPKVMKGDCTRQDHENVIYYHHGYNADHCQDLLNVIKNLKMCDQLLLADRRIEGMIGNLYCI